MVTWLGIWRHVTEGRKNRELWNSMESHGRLKKRNCIYIHYLVTNQASRFLASDFVFLCVLFCLVFSVYLQAVFWRNSAIIILYSRRYNSQQVFCCLLITLPLRPVKRIFDTFSPNNQRPLDQELTRQPEVLLYFPKHIPITTPQAAWSVPGQGSPDCSGKMYPKFLLTWSQGRWWWASNQKLAEIIATRVTR